MRHCLIVFSAIIFAMTLQTKAAAGIIVTKAGKVFIGAIQIAEDIEEHSIHMRWPYKGKATPSQFGNKKRVKFKREDLRWYDPRNDTLTLKYWDKHYKKPIDEAHKPPKDFSSRSTRSLGIEKLVGDFKVQSNQKLSTTTEHFQGLSFLMPEGWELSTFRNICILKSKGSNLAYPPRIHIVSSPRLSGPSPEIARKVQSWIQEFADGQRILEKDQKVVPLNANQKEIQLTLTIESQGRSIKTRRYLIIGRKYVHFVSCYCETPAFHEFVWLFQKFRDELQLPSEFESKVKAQPEKIPNTKSKQSTDQDTTKPAKK